MKTFLVCLCITVFVTVSNYAQTQTPPAPQPTPSREDARQREQERQQQIIQQQQRIEEQIRSNNLRIIGDVGNGRISDSRAVLNPNAVQNINALYRKTNKEELKLIAPSNEDLVKFADFLRQENTGIIKLVPDKGCADNTNIVVVTADCLAYTMPGAGSSYSFRVKDYRIQRLADITLFKNSFQATGIRLHGIFAAIGDVPLEQVNLQTKGAEFLVNFKPEADFQKAKELDQKISKGIESGGFLYRRAVAVKDDTTYLLRSVAYRGTYPRAVQGFTYNEFDFDKRSDIIVAFRTVRRYDDGSVLILWKRLAKKDSPKTKWKEETNKNGQTKGSDFTAKIK